MTSRISSIRYHTSLVATLYTAGPAMEVEGQGERDTMANKGHGVWMSHRTHTHTHNYRLMVIKRIVLHGKKITESLFFETNLHLYEEQSPL